MASTAHAQTFIYDVQGTNGQSFSSSSTVLTIDTATGQGTIRGSNINATFTGDFSGFTGGAIPSNFMADLNSLSGTRTINGQTLNVTDQTISPHPYKLVLDGQGGINLWAYWGGGTTYGDYFATTTGYTHPAPTSTSTGGLSSTGGTATPTGGTGGGTDVPAPGALLILGMGAAALAFGSRRKNKATI